MAKSPPEDDSNESGQKPKKERVLHTRVPAVLEQELKELAENLRVPVSNVVRTILEDAVSAVDVVGRRAESELKGAAQRLGQRRPAKGARSRDVDTASADEAPSPKAEAPLAHVIGYQALRLARDETCSLCGVRLERGGTAHLGIRDDGGPRVLVGDECLPFRANAGADERDDHRDDESSPEE